MTAAELSANNPQPPPTQDPIPLLRIFVFHLLDAVFRARRPQGGHGASKQAQSERWKDTVRLLRVALRTSRHCLDTSLHDHALKVLERAADYLGDLEKQQRSRKTDAAVNEEQDDRSRLARDLRSEYLGLRMTLVRLPSSHHLRFES